ncbi:glycosyltransferase family 2 protein [Asticcacaulis sp. EMRT-3]|uniref:glycosyltransferase family 2 protein n=1 Tax=Asticcacaulis sp. EMRT-3 TaxID=3040349 RepID=UPI0024AEEB6E|nr:glycosyltransferase family 2 protein [Asticcacaulis sp. EMRT-3]MDI7774353.1 glycosyltransferase [Asticcacaulis sp. EMRT-3]
MSWIFKAEAFREKWAYKNAYKDSGRTGTGPIRLFPGARPRRRRRSPILPLSRARSAIIRMTRHQAVLTLCLLGLLITASIFAPHTTLNTLQALLWTGFCANALLRVTAVFLPRRSVKTPYLHPAAMPYYSVIVALYNEANIVPQVVAAMQALRYPQDRLEILFALEEDDADTIAALCATDLPSYMRPILVPVGFPRTKPRALNHALTEARGDLVVIYDAEDRPDPGQLFEAARTFAASPKRLICLQAPLRPAHAQGFIARQFAAEYAVQFDVLLPALHYFGLPFPLGGTSNHFRAEALKKLGGWDAYNVTEDADLGLRLADSGYASGLLSLPTLETPTATSHAWIPQRTRWIKGYIQTLLVHTRLTAPRSLRVWAGVVIGVGLSVLASLCYAPLSFMMVVTLLLFGLQGTFDPGHAVRDPAMHDLLLFVLGNLAGLIAMQTGGKRAGLALRWRDLFAAPLYWSLQSIAAAFAAHQLFARPFHWDKTDHAPVSVPACQGLPQKDEPPLYEAAARQYGDEHDHRRHSHNLKNASLG